MLGFKAKALTNFFGLGFTLGDQSTFVA